jgi:hypothetical protein
MSLWERLFGRSSSPSRETAWEGIKREARENEQRRRRTLEQGPRATADEMTTRVASMRSIDQLIRAYNEMRHADFCDAVTAAVRAGNFSDRDTTHALYAREWVSSGGAWRTTLPEWIAAEGRQHFLRLNSEWLKSGEKYTPFNDWLVGITRSKAEPAAAPKPAQTVVQETGVPPRSNKQNEGEPSVQNGKWRFEGDQLVCNYELTGLPPPQTTTSLRIECAASRWDNGVLATYLDFYLTPYLYLIPDEEPFEPHLVKAPFALGLVADGSGRATEASSLVQGGMFEVNASGNEDTIPDTVILRIISSRDTLLAVRTLALGRDLTFTLIDYDTEPPVKLRLGLPGDRNFAPLYERLQRSV